MTSAVWKYFTKIDKNVAKCNICSKELKTGGGTSNLRHHLKHKHPDLTEEEEVQIRLVPRSSGGDRDGSDVWYHFDKADGKWKCRYCESQLSISGRNAIGNLKRHLKKKHPTVSFAREDESGDEHVNFENIYTTEPADDGSIEYFENSDDSPVVYMVSSSRKRPIKRRITISSNKLSRVSEDYRETFDDEFEHFCRSLSCQLRKMPIERALICQEKIQSVMTQERLQQLRTSTNEQGSIVINCQQGSEGTVSVEYP